MSTKLGAPDVQFSCLGTVLFRAFILSEGKTVGAVIGKRFVAILMYMLRGYIA